MLNVACLFARWYNFRNGVAYGGGVRWDIISLGPKSLAVLLYICYYSLALSVCQSICGCVSLSAAWWTTLNPIEMQLNSLFKKPHENMSFSFSCSFFKLSFNSWIDTGSVSLDKEDTRLFTTELRYWFPISMLAPLGAGLFSVSLWCTQDSLVLSQRWTF